MGLLKALVRDGFRCIITGGYDDESTDQCTELYHEVMGSNVAACPTNCVYIFPQSIAKISGFGAENAKVRFADSPLWLLIMPIRSTSMPRLFGLS